MVRKKSYAVILLSFCQLFAYVVLAQRTLAGATPNRAEALEKDSAPGNVAPLDSRLSGDDSGRTTKADIDRLMKELSNWGRWGATDQLGTINLISAAKRIEAAALVKSGLSVSLAHNDSTKEAVDNMPPFGHKMLVTGADSTSLFAMDQYVETYHTVGITHLDALAHMFYGNMLYNGFPRNSVTEAGAAKLSVLQLKDGIFSRGILFDIPRLKGRPYLEPGERIFPKDLDLWAKKSGVTVEPGDVILIRTGRWARRDERGPWNVGTSAPGLDVSCARWLRQHDVSVLGSDVDSDVMPSGVDGVSMPIHLLVLASIGMPILDNLDLERASQEAAKQHRWVFLLSVAPEPVPGGTGSPVNPIAIF